MFSEVCQRHEDTTRVDHDNYSNSSCKKYSLFRQIVLVVQQIVVCGDYCSPINSSASLILSGSPFDDTNLRSVQPKRSNFELYAWKWGDTCWSSCGAYTIYLYFFSLISIVSQVVLVRTKKQYRHFRMPYSP